MSTVRQYELVYIVPPETTEEALTELHTQIASVVERFGGNFEKTENWGRRKLAYEVGGHREGVYVLEVINGPGALTAELEFRMPTSPRAAPQTPARPGCGGSASQPPPSAGPPRGQP